ncbi:MAG: HNH endonuclease [Anaerolineae bacterium]|nr:HNH endonuclease [Anaerolineae bacterium]
MEVVTSIEDIESNLSLFENYLCDGNEEEEQFAYDLIRRGSCFVAYQIEGELRFSPSRYVGYLNNTRSKHLSNEDKDGRETNAAINRVIGYTLSPDEDLEANYLAFASSLGIEPYNKSRKYWRLNIAGSDFINNTNSTEGFPEGKLVERKHKARERSPALIAKAKNAFLKDNDHFFCSVCGFDFEEKYGERGSGFIEAHHTIPVSDMEPGQATRVEDIALICSNCHRMLHRTRPWLSIGMLKELLKNET